MSVTIYDHDESSPTGIRHVAVISHTGKARWDFEMCADTSVTGSARSLRAAKQQISNIDQQLLTGK